MRHRVLLLALSLFLLPLHAFGKVAPGEPQWVPQAELMKALREAPRANSERVAKLRQLFETAGAPAAAISLDPVAGDGDAQSNVIVRLPGSDPRLAPLVVGAHLDKVPPGDGIVDDWSGASMLPQLYRTLKGLPRQRGIVFIGFAREEEGLLGSKQALARFRDEKTGIAAMINLECLGIDGPFVWVNGSDAALARTAHAVADRHGLPLLDHVLEGVEADSTPFRKAGIPAMTIDGMAEAHFSAIHSDNDRFEQIDAATYERTYRLLVWLLRDLDTPSRQH